MTKNCSRASATVTAIAFTFVLLVSNATAQNVNELSDAENQAKVNVLTEFLANREAFLQTVNLIDVATLPATFPFVDVAEHPVVNVSVAGGEALPFLFDTGAPTTVSQQLADAHGGDVIVETVAAAGGGIMFWSPLRLYPSLTVGGSVTVTEAMGEAPWNAPGALYCVSPHGLLGAPAMSNAVWQIHYGKQEITVAASVEQLDHVEGSIAIPFTRGQGTSPTPHIQLGVGEDALEILVDTGGGIPLTVNTEAIASVGIEIPGDAPALDNLAFGAGGAFASPVAFVDLPVRFGDAELVVPVMVGDGMAPTASGNMGHGFLKNFVVTFDFPNDTMFLDPLFDGNRVPPVGAPAGAGVLWADGQIIVASIPRGSPAEEAGLTVGEVVAMIDGKSVTDITIDDYCAHVHGVRHGTITTESGRTYDTSPIEGFYGSEG